MTYVFLVTSATKFSIFIKMCDFVTDSFTTWRVQHILIECFARLTAIMLYPNRNAEFGFTVSIVVILTSVIKNVGGRQKTLKIQH